MLELLSGLTGALFTLAAAYWLGRTFLRGSVLPRTIYLAAGSALLSFVIFALLALKIARPISFLAVGAVSVALGAVYGRRSKTDDEIAGLTGWLLLAIGGIYGVLYGIHALAPEIQPDAIGYHLGLVAEWLRAGRFPRRIGFYEVLPLGTETLFAFAYAAGEHTGAKLVHCGFLVATLPLMIAAGRRLGLDAWQTAGAALLYAITPVVGVSATSAYNDAALAFFALATFYLLLRWRQDDDARLLLAAGLTAGFCYAIKITGALVPLLALVWIVASRRRPGDAVHFALPAVLVAAPWIVRAWILTGNPAAPLLNRWFPNPYFHSAIEEQLGAQLRSYDLEGLAQVPLELTIRGEALQGLLGPVFLLAPLALLALRRQHGRLVIAAAALLAAPWLLNHGTRFLIPSLPFLAYAFAMALPRPAFLAVLGAHALLSWPHVLDRYAAPAAWRLHGIPWQAALRVETKDAYFDRYIPAEYATAQLTHERLRPGEKFFDLAGAAAAYTHAVPIVPWQATSSARLLEALRLAASPETTAFFAARSSWPMEVFSTLRLRHAKGGSLPWAVHDVELRRGERRVRPDPRSTLAAWPSLYEAPLAFDRSIVSAWSTWEPAPLGAFLEIEFPEPLALSGINVTYRKYSGGPIEIHGRTALGEWRMLDPDPQVYEVPAANLRRAALRLLLAQEIRYILAPVSADGYGPLGKTLVRDSVEWGLVPEGSVYDVHLLRIP